MQQIRQPQSIKKFISGNFFQKSIEDIIIVQEFQLMHFYDQQLQSILETNIKILDAISITDQSNFDFIAILYFTGDIEIYSPFDNLIKKKIKIIKNSEKKKPYKLYYNNNNIYLLDYINGMIKINLQTQEIDEVADIKSKVVHMQYLEFCFVVIYFEKNILRLKGMDGKFGLAFKYSHYQLNQKILIFKHLVIFYSFKTIQIYNQVNGQIQADYDKLLSSNIVDIFQMGDDELKLIIVLQNGWIDQITYSQTNMFNHQNLYQLPISNIITCHKTSSKQFCVLSYDKVALFNQNFELRYEVKIFNLFTHIFENNNNLYAGQLKGLCQIKQFRKIQNKQLIIKKFQFENVKFFLQTSSKMLVIITSNIVSLYYDNQLISQFQSSIEIEFAIMLEEQYLIISNQQVMQLLSIDKNKITYKTQLDQDALILQYHTQNTFSVYSENGKIKLFNIVDGFINQVTEIGQYYDITMYNFQSQNHCLISYFDCTISLYNYKDFQLQQQREIARQKINSICVSIYFDEDIYCLITQNCWLYRVNGILEVLESIQLFGKGMLAQNIFTGNKFSLIQTQLDGKRIYEMIDSKEQIIVKTQEDEQLFANNQGQLYSIYQSDIYNLELDQKREYDFFQTNILNTQEQAINFKYNFLITNNIIYRINLERLDILYQSQKNKFLLSDITQKYIALSDQNQQLQIFQIYVGQKLTDEIKEIKVFQFENCKISALKISEDILLLGIWNEIQIYSLKTFQKLESFKAIFPSTDYSIENEIKQIRIQQHSENQLVFDILIDKAGIVIITMKISQSNEIQYYKVDKKFYSPIIGCRNLRMEQIQNYWQLFNVKGECLKFKLTKYFFDQFLQPIDEKNKQIMNDLIVDTVNYKSTKFYIGICGGIWKHDL